MPILAKTLAHQCRHAFDQIGYARKGGKQNRRQQIGRACEVCDWCQQHHQVRDLHQLGAAHIISFWKHHRSWKDSTRYGYWLALKVLWPLIGKASHPPKPTKLDKPPAPLTIGPAIETNEEIQTESRRNGAFSGN